MHLNTAIPLKDLKDIKPRAECLLDKAIRYPLVTIMAGPGYGKTQTVAAYVRKLDANISWIRLTKLDNISSRFWFSFVESVRNTNHDFADRLAEIGFPDSMTKFDMFIRLLAKELYSGSQWVLVLDEYEEIYENQIHFFVENLVDSNLENFCLIIISRKNVGLNLLNMIDSGLIFQITEDDLKMNRDEIEELFEEYGIETTDALLNDVFLQTEGWPLAVNSLLSHYKRKREIDDKAVFGSMPLVWRLFEKENYLIYEDKIRLLIVKLSLLSSFPADIVPKLTDIPEDDAYKALESNSFVNYDSVTHIYTFHNLYNDFLLQRISIIPEADIKEVYSIAADWYMENGRTLDAITYYGKCGLYEKLLKALDSVPKHRLDRELANFVIDYLDSFPEDFIKTHPIITFRKATYHLNNLESGKAVKILEGLIEELESGEQTPEKRALLGEVYLILGDICIMRNSDCFAMYDKMADKLLPGGSTQRGEELYAVENHNIFFIQHNRPGEVERLRQIFFDNIPVTERLMNGSGYGMAYLYSAEAAFFTYDFARAQEDAYKAIYMAGERNQYDIIANSHFILMRVEMMSGDYESCVSHLEKIRKVIRGNNIIDLFNIVDYADGWLYAWLGDFDRIPWWLVDQSICTVKQRPMSIGRDSLIKTACLLRQKRYYELLAVLEHLIAFYQKRGLWVSLLDSYILRAVCHMKYGDRKKAVRSLYIAYEMSHKNNIITPFIDHNTNMRTLIDIARRSDEYEFDPGWLESVQQKSSTYAKRISSISANYFMANNSQKPGSAGLTDRETEVLHCLSQGLTREEIGNYLKISVNTVKTIIKSIYKKLNAVNRSDAVRIATLTGIIA